MVLYRPLVRSSVIPAKGLASAITGRCRAHWTRFEEGWGWRGEREKEVTKCVRKNRPYNGTLIALPVPRKAFVCWFMPMSVCTLSSVVRHRIESISIGSVYPIDSANLRDSVVPAPLNMSIVPREAASFQNWSECCKIKLPTEYLIEE